jgi:hypothetical protein
MVLNAAVDDFVARRAILGIRSIGGKVKINSSGEFETEPPVQD